MQFHLTRADCKLGFYQRVIKCKRGERAINGAGNGPNDAALFFESERRLANRCRRNPPIAAPVRERMQNAGEFIHKI